jgi:pimeloyl-ACP methyl ester carboxylesterase
MLRERRIGAQDGLELYYRDYGDPLSARLPVLCLSGITRNSRDFTELAERLSYTRRVLCPDYRGRGLSARDPDWRNYEARTYLNDVLHVLAAAGVPRAVVIGTSLGGLLAMALAVLRPTAVAGIVLNDIGPEVAAGGIERIAAYIGTDRPQPDWDTAVAYLQHAMPHLALPSEAAWRRLARGTFREGADGRLHFDWDTSVVKPLLRARGTVRDLWPLFRAVRGLPVLAFRGERSDVLSADAFDRMGREKPDMIRVLVPGAAHAPALDEPDCENAIDEFLSRF